MANHTRILRAVRRRNLRIRAKQPFDDAEARAARAERARLKGARLKRLGRELGPRPVSPKRLRALIRAALEEV